MKTKLLFVLLFICSISYGQIPTTNLVAWYQFDNSNPLIDGVQGSSLSKTGTNSSVSTDRFGNANALSLNGDILDRADMPTTGAIDNALTINFWMNTTSTATEYLINDSNDDTIGTFLSQANYLTRHGYKIYIHNGIIKAKVLSYRGSGSHVVLDTPQGTNDDVVVNDGKWHHVSISIKEHKVPHPTTPSYGFNTNLIIKIAIDNQSNPSNFNSYLTPGNDVFHATKNIHDTGTFHIGNKPTLESGLSYSGAIDDMLVYDRLLTSAELTQITNDGGYCTTPEFGELSSFTSTSTTNTIAFNLLDADTYSVAYHLVSQPFANAIIINGLSNATTNGVVLANLIENANYSVYVRKQCTANTTAWSLPRTIKTERPTGITRLYVNENATGANNGLNWTNAYTNANDAIINAVDNDEIWIAAGTYTPHATDRTIFFTVDKENLKIYGGFVGTETTLSQRDFRANITILSGEIGNNNVTSDNSYHVFYVVDDGASLDGITISDGNAIGQGNDNYGAGIFKLRPVNSLTIKNCIIKNNNANNGGAGITAEYESAGGDLDIDNCIFDNNVSRFGSAVYAQSRNTGTFTFNVSNSLFNNNKAQDMATGGFAASAGFFQTNNSASVANVKLTNNTYVNNSDTGAGLNNFTRATIGASEGSGTLNLEVANCIFYNNTISGGLVANAITGINGTLAPNTTVINSIDEDGFSKLTPANLTGTSTSDPLFTSATDYTLQSGSSAINAGDNTKVLGNTDLLGNNRIFNTTVDMGAYEFGSSVLGIDDVNKIEGLKMYPNPTKGSLTFDLQESIKTIEFFNLQGQVIKKFMTKKIDISNISNGIYMVKITAESGKTAIKKVVKN